MHFLAGGRPFGPFTSRNLTPDPSTGLPAELTFDEFKLALRTGADHDHLHPAMPLLQVMPWPELQGLTTRDLRAMYEYLSALPHADPCLVVGPAAPDPTCRP